MSAFSRRNARRIKDVTLRIERQPKNTIKPSKYPIFNGNATCYVYSSGGATAFAGSTLGTGTGLLQQRNASTRVLSSVTPNVTITFDNVGGTITGPAYIMLIQVAGNWSSTVTKC